MATSYKSKTDSKTRDEEEEEKQQDLSTNPVNVAALVAKWESKKEKIEEEKPPEIIALEATLKGFHEIREELRQFRIYDPTFEECINEILQNPQKLIHFIDKMATDVEIVSEILPIKSTSHSNLRSMIKDAQDAFYSFNKDKIRAFRILLNDCLDQILKDIKKALPKNQDQKTVYHNMEVGDIIRVDRGSYFHYAVVSDISNPYNKQLIHYGYEKEGDKKAKVKNTPFMEVVQNHKVKIQNDLCNRPSLPVPEIKKRMESKLNQTDYNLFTNNCEHFATWCRYGEKRSNQVRNVHTTTYKFVKHHVKEAVVKVCKKIRSLFCGKKKK